MFTSLYTYCLRYDTGAAPNPFWGTCTLVICKPSIRKTAKVGDWVVGMGSAQSPIGDLSSSVVYAMKVTEKMTMQEYDSFTKKQLPQKIPNWYSYDSRLKVGDSIYDFSDNPQHPKLRKSVHNESDKNDDLDGKYALLSNHFFYFGDQAQPLPNDMQDNIVKKGPGHRSDSNNPYIDRFLDWLDSLNLEPNHIYGTPLDRNRSGGC